MSEHKATYSQLPIAEMTNGIILANYDRVKESVFSYQTEQELEQNFILNLVKQGYERLVAKNSADLFNNLKVQIEKLNKVSFTAKEWDRFLVEYLNRPNEGIIEKSRKIQEDYIYDFKFDNGILKNIKILDKKNIHNNTLQVVNQIEQTGVHKNRYDVTILVNGLPLIHIELKKRGVELREAFDQINRYEYESFNEEDSLYKFVQIFVISNGTYTRYFANTIERNKKNYEFTCEWADAKNKVIHDLEDFTATFFEKRTLLEVITKYCVFDTNNVLLIMRPYQIAATERILWKIESSYNNNRSGSVGAGGFIWHTTGSGKTLTSFKTARLATELPYIDKVFFVVDRKDLDYQTMKEYQKFQPDSVNGSKDTKELKRSIEKEDNKIVVTTIQKLNEFIKSNPKHEIFGKHCVLIYDECHRSQFGEAQRNIKKKFKHYYQFGFTGTPTFAENALGTETTVDVFGVQLHSYVITDAIRDGKVLKFKVDYNNIVPKFKSAETEDDHEKLKNLEKKMFLHPERISEITKYILNVYDRKTHRNQFIEVKKRKINGFNAMFAVQSVEAAKAYYEEFVNQQKHLPEDKRLKVATIYSYASNEARPESGEIEENFEAKALTSTAKQFLDKVIDDYNNMFQTNFSTAGNEFQNYYKDLSQKVKNKEIDILIVVGMFLTGFDAPTMNTLFVDKNLRYHGLIQAYSRTNRILNSVKQFGNIVCFRDLEKATKDAIRTFGDQNSINVILEKSYDEYISGHTDEETGVKKKGYVEVCQELVEKFPNPTEIYSEKEQKEFIKLFGEALKLENILRNYDEFEKFEPIIPERRKQDMKSVYIELKNSNVSPLIGDRDKDGAGSVIDFDDVEFYIDLLKTDEINLDYILTLILEKSKQVDNKEVLKDEISRTIKTSVDTREKESLVIDYIDNNTLEKLKASSDLVGDFYKYAKERRELEVSILVENENLKPEAKRIIDKAINKGEISRAGSELDSVLPPLSRRGGAREQKKQSLIKKIRKVVKKFTGI